MGKSTGKDEEAAWWTRIKSLYEKLLKGFLKRRFLTILLFIGFLGFSGVLFKTKMTYVLFPYNDVDSLFVLAEMLVPALYAMSIFGFLQGNLHGICSHSTP